MNERVRAAVIVFAGMPVLRVVAAADVTAHQTQPQLDPRVAHLQTLFAAVCAGRHVVDLIEVRAIHLAKSLQHIGAAHRFAS